jgi:hypothetical protein
MRLPFPALNASSLFDAPQAWRNLKTFLVPTHSEQQRAAAEVKSVSLLGETAPQEF